MGARIVAGELADNVKSGRVKSGAAGAAARIDSLSPERRKEIAQKASAARWKKP